MLAHKLTTLVGLGSGHTCMLMSFVQDLTLSFGFPFTSATRPIPLGVIHLGVGSP